MTGTESTNPAAGKAARLSPTQKDFLRSAASNPEGTLDLSGKQNATANALLSRGLVAQLPAPRGKKRQTDTGPLLRITAAGLRAIGAPDAMIVSDQSSSAADGAEIAGSALPDHASDATDVAERTSAQTKQDLILSLLKRPEGAIGELSTASAWQPHSVRGFLSATVRKRLGQTVTSERDEGGVRRYRITV